MHVAVLGINFKTAPIASHEAIAKAALSLFATNLLSPFVLISTCNRTEIYFSSFDIEKEEQEILSYFARFKLDLRGIYLWQNEDCFIHLCRVIAGLDSADLLETEITRQVKMAYANAANRYKLSSALHFLFQKSLQIAKATKNLRGLFSKGPAFLHTLWTIAEENLGDLSTKKILFVGYSKTHRSFASFLARRGIRNIVFCSRDPAQVAGYSAVDRQELARWNEYDWISCASLSDSFLIEGKGERRHLIFDLSVPRNVNPNVAQGEVFLWNMEQINQKMQQETGDLSLQESHIRHSIDRLKLRVTRISWERDHIPDVLHSGCQ